MGNRHKPLDSLRGILALVVLLAHGLIYFGILPPHDHAKWGLLAPVYYRTFAVNTFFVLSGFILDRIYRETFTHGLSSYGRFMVYRFARLWPLHGVALACIAATLTFAPRETGTLPDLVAGLLFLNGPWNEPGIWNPPSWSVGAEWHLYLAFPLLCALPVRGSILLACGLAALALYTALPLDGIQQHGHPSVMLRAGGMFIAGMGVNRLMKSRLFRCDKAILAVSATIMALTFTGIPPNVLSLLAPFLVWTVAANDGVTRRAMSARPLVCLGDWSYAIYMLHFPLVLVMMTASYHAFGVFRLTYIHALGPEVSIPILLTYIAAIIASARVCYHLIERRARKHIRHISS